MMDAEAVVAEALANRARAEDRIRGSFMGGVRRMRGWLDERPDETSLLDIVELPIVDLLGRPMLDAWMPALEASAGRGIWIGVPLEEPATEKAVRPDVVAIARRLVREHGARLVSNVTATTRRAIVATVERGIRQNQTVRQVRDALRSVVGLNARQERTLATYRQSLIDDGVGPARLRKLVAARRDQMVRYRALMIARTETARAENDARREAWARLAVEGQLDPRLFRKWITLDPCPYCRELGRHRAVALGEPYVSRKYGAIYGPPAHPQCKCTEALVLRRR